MCCPLFSYSVRLRPCYQITGSISTIPSLTMQWPLLTLARGYDHATPFPSQHPLYGQAVPQDLLRGHKGLRDYVLVPYLPESQYHSLSRLHLAPRNQRYALSSLMKSYLSIFDKVSQSRTG